VRAAAVLKKWYARKTTVPLTEAYSEKYQSKWTQIFSAPCLLEPSAAARATGLLPVQLKALNVTKDIGLGLAPRAIRLAALFVRSSAMRRSSPSPPSPLDSDQWRPSGSIPA